ncbi:hypothetical protein KR009_009009 [Drosophila setifemur]|nr:hypothetical protein KR009_009009 [Drosophila setifemur]
MENLNGTSSAQEFDWDAINVGDYQLDHSQNFFAKANKENNAYFNNVNFLLASATPQSKFSGLLGDPGSCRDPIKIEPLKWEVKSEVKVEAEPNPSQSQSQSSEHGEVKPLPIEDLNELKPEADQHLTAEPPRAPMANLRLEWSPLRLQNPQAAGPGAGGTGSSPVPNAYEFKNVYECNRQQALRKREEEERKARQFHSRPMPNFKVMHKRLYDMEVQHKLTVPKTPDLIKRWQADKERRWQRGHSEKVKDEKPQQQLRCPTKPFQLRSEQRVRDRREFDAAVQMSMDQKKKEVSHRP